MSSSTQSHDLRNRILFTILILAIYRLGTFVPLPGIDPEQLQIMMESNQKGLLGMFNVFACLLYTSPSPRDLSTSRMPSSA